MDWWRVEASEGIRPPWLAPPIQYARHFIYVYIEGGPAPQHPVDDFVITHCASFYLRGASTLLMGE